MQLLNASASCVMFGVFVNCGAVTLVLIVFSSFGSRYGGQWVSDCGLKSLSEVLACNRETNARPHSIAEIYVIADDDLFMLLS
jgi:hypothetical protein